jgi:uncharacterized protein (TIGR02145 family)
MKQLFLTILAFSMLSLVANGQVPQKFSYQAAIRNSDGTVMSEEEVDIQVKLRTLTTEGDVVYEEVHMTQTNAQGVVSIAVGAGATPKGSFGEIPWSDGIFIEVGVKLRAESTFNILGVSQILSVPYALQAASLSQGAKEVKASIDHNPEEAIFVVRNNNNEIVFAVYEDGVRINVNAPEKSKSSRGGFAVGGLSGQNKADAPNYLTILPDMVEFNIVQPDPTDPLKSSRGGFAVGGLSGQNKGVTPFFKVNSDSTYIMNTLTATGNVIVTGDMLTGGSIGTLPGTDNEGNTFPTVSLGGNTWMAENLKTTKYRDGQEIMMINNPDIPAYYLPQDETGGQYDPSFYGYLYILKEIDATRVCPKGWRLPTAIDWTNLINSTNAMYNAISLVDLTPGIWKGGMDPEPLKRSDKSTSGFKARPAGILQNEVVPPVLNYWGAGFTATFWTMPVPDPQIPGAFRSQHYSIESEGSEYFYLNYGSESFDPEWQYFSGRSIRCVKETAVTVP